MPYTTLPDRSSETTKLLRRSKGVFSKIRRTLTSPPQFRISQLSGPEGCSTAALLERCSCKRTNDYNNTGTVIPTHNCIQPNSDVGNALVRDWKPFPFLSKGRLQCKRSSIKKQFLPDGAYVACPFDRYISDRRPRGISPQQLDSAGYFFETTGGITLSRFLNGSVGYRTDSEDSQKSPGRCCRIQSIRVHKTAFGKDAVIPDICLERRSTGNIGIFAPGKTEKAVIPC
jgi:hypothetical protein